ncbi:MAG TPA: immunoglobulin domain-containing protein [Verrucomicrobiae bacterium]|jgi:uncharacterized repeat protein (TIGR01451 family)|nr:immunoglobulin domain-containing protein [Verrucomicrobiae bacterium]
MKSTEQNTQRLAGTRFVTGALRGLMALAILILVSVAASAAPVLTSVTANGNAIVARGSLNAAANSAFQLDFYESPTGNPADNKTYIGSSSVETDGSGNATFFVSFPPTVPLNDYVLATATDSGNNVSDFSNSLQFAPTNSVSLALTMGASSNTVRVGDQVAFTVKLVNSSANDATGIVVKDVFPASFIYAYSTATQFTPPAPTGNTITWNVGTLGAGASATLTVFASGNAVGGATNVASFIQDQYNLNFGAATNQYSLNVSAPSAILINLQPITQLLNLGGLLNLVTGILGSPNAHYQWRLNGENIPGATNSTYSKATLNLGDGGLYTCVVSDLTGALTSDGAIINIGGLLPLPASDSFASRGDMGLVALPIVGGLLGGVGSNVSATSEPGEPVHAGVPGGKSVWLKWTPSLLLTKGTATISTAGSSFDTVIAVYTGTTLSNLTPVVSDDDAGGYYTSSVTFNVTPGTSYAIAIDGAYGASGQIVISASYNPLAAAIPQISTQPANQIVTTGGTATFAVTAGSGSTYQWYQNGAAISGATSANLLVKNASVASVGIYTVKVTKSNQSITSKPASLEISVLDGAVNTNAVAADKFQTAYTAVQNEAQGLPFSKNGTIASYGVSSFGPASARSVSDAGGTSRGYSSTQVFSTYGGATQTGEPNHCGNAGGNSSWASVQAADNGVLVIDTDGSSFNTILAVYTGNGDDFASLMPVACDIGSGQGGTNSRVSFAATSNTVYYVAVDSVNGTAGTVVLNANLTVPPTITAQPVSQTVSPGATLSLAAAAAGHLTPGCQWWHNGGLLSGATNVMLTITNFQYGKCGTYQMVATNALGAAVTTPVSIFLNTPMRLDSFVFNPTNATAQLRLIGTVNKSYVLQTSPDLIHWFPLSTNLATTGILSLNDSNATNSAGYYRAVPAQ